MKISLAISVAVAALANQVSATIPITGVRTGIQGTKPPARQNIVDLYNKGGPQWTLYIRALDYWYYQTDDKDPESFFQMAGIHGRPIIPWDSDEEGKVQMGYCPHIVRFVNEWHGWKTCASSNSEIGEPIPAVAPSLPRPRRGMSTQAPIFEGEAVLTRGIANPRRPRSGSCQGV